MTFKVLIVDDEPDLEILIRQKFRREMREGGLAFVFASNGREALTKIEESADIDIVVSDINMPIMDGLTLLSRLNDIDRTLKAVIVSAYGDMGNIRTAMNRGAFDFLTKPIDFKDLEVTLNKSIGELEIIRQGVKAREQLTVLRHELSIAARIQQSILPSTFPPSSAEDELDAYATMIPAKEVGGDFYDLFMIDPSRIGFVMADVTGKGVPAAIFMAVCSTLLRATAIHGMGAAECVGYVNEVLVEQSDTSMFVTAFYGILDLTSGELEYCIGGHNPPFLLSASGAVSNLSEPVNLVVGAFRKADYAAGRARLEPGDHLFLYTDGVTEAMNADDEEFSEERLKRLLEGFGEGSAKDLARNAIAAVQTFSENCEQSDDLTVMALKYLGPE